jgi:hypothetical protein
MFFNPATGTFQGGPDDPIGESLSGAVGMPPDDQYGDPGMPEPYGANPYADVPAEPDQNPYAVDDTLIDERLEPPAPLPQAPPAAPQEPPLAGSSQSSGSGYSFRGHLNAPPPPVDLENSAGMAQYQQGVQNKAIALGQAEGAIEGAEAAKPAIYDEAERVAAEDRRMRAERVKSRDEAMRAQDAKIQQAVDAVPTADPGRVFSNMSAFTKGIMIIASGLNGWNVKYNQGKNPIVETLMQLSQDDMAAQKINIETAREKVFRAERGYDRLDKAEEAKLHDFDIGVLQRATAFDKQLARLDASTQSAVSKANIAATRAELSMGMGSLRMSILEKAGARNDDIWAKQMVQVQENSRQARSQRFAASEAEKKRAQKDAGVANLFDGKAFGIKFEKNTADDDKHVIDLGDPKIAQEINDTARKGTTVISAVNQVLAAFKPGRALPGTQGRELAMRNMRQIMADYVLAEGRGLSDSDFKALESALGDPDPNRIFRLVSDETFQKKLISFRDGVQQKTELGVNRYESVYGKAVYRPPAPRVLIDPPDKRLTFPQAMKSLESELAKGASADAGKVAGYLDAFSTLRKQSVAGTIDLARSKELVEAVRLRALALPRVAKDTEMQDVINNVANSAITSVQADIDGSAEAADLARRNEPVQGLPWGL